MPKISVRLIIAALVFFGLVIVALVFGDEVSTSRRATFIGLVIGSIFVIFSVVKALRNKDGHGE